MGQEVEKFVPVPQMATTEKIVAVPQVVGREVEKFVPVPQVATTEKIVGVPQVVGREVEKFVPVPQVATTEKIVGVPQVVGLGAAAQYVTFRGMQLPHFHETRLRTLHPATLREHANLLYSTIGHTALGKAVPVNDYELV